MRVELKQEIAPTLYVNWVYVFYMSQLYLSFTHSPLGLIKTLDSGLDLIHWCAGYIDWITQAEELAELEAEDQQNAIKVTRRIMMKDDNNTHFYSGRPQLRQAEQHRGRAPQVSHAAAAAGGGR